jgi:hypothetical protein
MFTVRLGMIAPPSSSCFADSAAVESNRDFPSLSRISDRHPAVAAGGSSIIFWTASVANAADTFPAALLCLRL